ncbi:MAG: PA2169 family four-helix-bundle protein [Geminicoccaceae bacterium]|nr:MAG: PA2169 family four-helix-bundle protein [Geminicoccaceae bacterium]
MTTASDKHVKTLNDLISTTLDSALGYEEAAKAAAKPTFKTLFDDRAKARRQLAGDLQAEVRKLGGKPEDDGSMMGAAHRMFLNLKHTVTGTDQSVIAEVESGESHIKAKFDDALATEALPESARLVMKRVNEAINADHDKMITVKHALQAPAEH